MGRQGELLTLMDPNPVLSPELRKALVPMMAALLLEAAAEPTDNVAPEAADWEVDDDQDRG